MTGSPMSARERVRAALDRRPPDRVPFSWQFCATAEQQEVLRRDLAVMGLSWDRLRAETEDIGYVGVEYTGGTPLSSPWDVFGIRWKDVDYGGGTYRELDVLPLAGVDSRQALDDFPWPDPDLYGYDKLAAQARGELPDPHRAHKVWAGNPFETYCWMTGLEEALANLVERPELVVRALEYICAFYQERLERTLRAGGALADIVFFFDDLGTQQGPMMSPAMYRDLLQPFHRRLFGAARRLAPHARIMMHSDGSVFDLLGDLLDAGMEVLEAVQVDAAGMEPERLKAAYGDRLAFHGAISVQQLLPDPDAGRVRREVRRLMDVLGRGGGYVAAPSHAMQLGTPAANVLAMLETVLGPDDYGRARTAAARPVA